MKYLIFIIKMPQKLKEFNSTEISMTANEILRILKECPKYNIIEILEYAKELRDNEGDIEDVDYEVETSSSEEEYETDTEESEEEQDSESD